MTDFNSINNIDSTQNYIPFLNKDDNLPNKLNQEPKIIQNSITPEVNSQNKEYIIYKTPFGSIQIFMFIMMIFVIIFSIIFQIA